MMNKEQKKQYISDMTNQFEKSEAVIVTHYQGLTMNQLDELRAKMREHGIIFKIILTASGDKKINVIKEVRAITALGLNEAKDLVEGAPKEIKSGVNKKEAEEIKQKLEAAGAKVELK